MARPLRTYTPDLSVHVIRRGNNRGAVFNDDTDRHQFLRELEYAAGDNRVLVHGFVMMTTHYHLLVTPQDEIALPGMMKTLGEEYGRYYNRRHDHIGTLWAGRYKPIDIDNERRWLTCLRYIEQNPWRAKMVDSPLSYRWSSCRAHSLGETLEWLVPHRLYLALGSTPEERQAAYCAIVCEGLTEEELIRQRGAKS